MPPARAFFHLQQLEQLARRRLDERLSEFGITAGRYMALSLLVPHEPLPLSELARLANITAQSMGEFVKTLESKGLIERRDSPEDKRSIMISSTPEGRRVLIKCETRIDEAEREFFDCLSAEDQAQLNQLLMRVRRQHLGAMRADSPPAPRSAREPRKQPAPGDQAVIKST